MMSMNFQKLTRILLCSLPLLFLYTIYLMFLDKVGGRGMNLKLIKRLGKQLIQHRVYVAGGIKAQGQIEQLKSLGVKGVILSTLIHNRISRDKNLSP